jgi:hypothetical protein
MSDVSKASLEKAAKNYGDAEVIEDVGSAQMLARENLAGGAEKIDQVAQDVWDDLTEERGQVGVGPPVIGDLDAARAFVGEVEMELLKQDTFGEK